MKVVQGPEGKKFGLIERPEPEPALEDRAELEAKLAAELAELEAKRRAAKARVDAAAAAKSAADEDHAVKVAEAQLALKREERAAEIAEHELKTDAIYRAACLEHGEEMVARIPTRDGSIVLRYETEKESDERLKLVTAHAREADAAASPDMRARHLQNVEEQARMSISKLVLSDKAHLARVTAKYQLWGTIERARADLVSGRVIAEGKGVGA